MKRKHMISISLVILVLLSLVLTITVNKSAFAGTVALFILSFVTYIEYLRGLEPKEKFSVFYTNTLKYAFQSRGKLNLYKTIMKWVWTVSAILGVVLLIIKVIRIIFA